MIENLLNSTILKMLGGGGYTPQYPPQLRPWSRSQSSRKRCALNISRFLNLYSFVGVGDNFMIMKLSKSTWKGYEARLQSDEITGSVCMKFYFYLYGNNTGFLKIMTKKQGSSKNVVFNRFGNHGHKWNFAQVYLDFSPTDVYQVLHNVNILLCSIYLEISLRRLAQHFPNFREV